LDFAASPWANPLLFVTEWVLKRQCSWPGAETLHLASESSPGFAMGLLLGSGLAFALPNVKKCKFALSCHVFIAYVVPFSHPFRARMTSRYPCFAELSVMVRFQCAPGSSSSTWSRRGSQRSRRSSSSARLPWFARADFRLRF